MKLHEQRDILKARNETALEQIHKMAVYLQSSKFSGDDPFDKYVNRDEILRWFEQVVRPTLNGSFDDDPDIIKI